MARKTGQVTVTSVATLILPLDADRTSVILTNTDQSTTVYTGDSTVTATTGDDLPPNATEQWSQKEGDDTVSPFYGITPAGQTAVVTYEYDKT